MRILPWKKVGLALVAFVFIGVFTFAIGGFRCFMGRCDHAKPHDEYTGSTFSSYDIGYRDGYNAYGKHTPNPYRPGIPRYRGWTDGYLAAETLIERNKP